MSDTTRAALAREALLQELLAAAVVALNEMCHTTATRNSYTDAVDRLDAAITAFARLAPEPSHGDDAIVEADYLETEIRRVFEARGWHPTATPRELAEQIAMARYGRPATWAGA